MVSHTSAYNQNAFGYPELSVSVLREDAGILMIESFASRQADMPTVVMAGNSQIKIRTV